MSSDISRQRFDPTRDFAAVLMQQGRVLLDADWNEWVEILDRRLRAETTDIIGRGVVPKETPHGFEIGISGSSLTIGQGRIYVDGILAEHHGQPPQEWDPVLAELRGKAPVRYENQPYLPDPGLIDSPPQEGGPHLVYLVVWRREVTWLEEPGLVESAVGVDSTTRWQTVWQVRVLPNVGAGTTCDSDIAAWRDLTRPSAGRLTTDTFNAPGDPDPCQVPPTGGYKGLENRLYRVEIHSVNPATGAATFKWARHNASIATAVNQIKGEDLMVDLIGRDADLRFNIGDWIEITDDARELAGLPGFMRKVKDVSDAALKITMDGALPPGAFPLNPDGTTLKPRHTRIRRWDQRGQIRTTTGVVHHDLDAVEPDELKKGVIPVPAAGTALLLEDGVQVSFSLEPVGGRFLPGDYWVFAARTADASIEKLNAAPPRGIHRHFCRLALVTFPGPPTDCREFWPPEFGEECCDCTVCVTADSHNHGTLTIQQAIDQVQPTGGTVCLGPGIYNITESFIRIAGAQSMRIRGQGWRTILAHTGPGSTLQVRGCLGLTLERFTVLTGRAADGAPDLAIENSADVAVRDCYFLQIGAADQIKAAIGLGGVLVHARIQDNVFFASAGIANAAARQIDGGVVGVAAARALLTLGLHCERNQFVCSNFGVRLSGFCVHLGETRIADNLFHGARDGGVVANGAVLAQAWGGSRLDVMGNSLHVAGDGILVGTDDARIHLNDIGPASRTRSGDGIVIGRGLLARPLMRLQITNNRVLQVEGHGVHLRAPLRSGLIKQNQLEGMAGGGIIMDVESSAENLVIENNQLIGVLNLTSAASEKEALLAAIHVVRVVQVDVSNNLVRDAGARAAQARRLVGIQATSCARIRVAGNRVVNLGPVEASLREADAIAVIGLHEYADITGNSVQRHETSPVSLGDNSRWRAVWIGFDREHGSSLGSALLVRIKTIEVYFSANRAFIRLLAPEVAGLRGNTLVGYGSAPTVEVVSTGRVAVSDNHAALLSPGPPVMVVTAAKMILSANHVERAGGEGGVVFLQVPERQFTVLGNVASGRIVVNNNPLQPPWEPLNVQTA